MKDKGYAHPLCSLDLVSADLRPAAAEDAAIPVPGGLLVVSPELLRQGKKFAAPSCQRAVLRALRFFHAHGEALWEVGLTPAWAEHMAHWTGQMIEWSAARFLTELRLAHLYASKDDALEDGRALLRRLSLSIRLGHLSASLPPLVPARAEVALLRQIAEGHARAAGLAAALQRSGFHAADGAALAEIGPLVDTLRARIATQERDRRDLSGLLIVVRGALVGDLRLFSGAVRARYPARVAAQVAMGSLLPEGGPRGRSPGPAGPAPPTPGP